MCFRQLLGLESVRNWEELCERQNYSDETVRHFFVCIPRHLRSTVHYQLRTYYGFGRGHSHSHQNIKGRLPRRGMLSPFISNNPNFSQCCRMFSFLCHRWTSTTLKLPLWARIESSEFSPPLKLEIMSKKHCFEYLLLSIDRCCRVLTWRAIFTSLALLCTIQCSSAGIIILLRLWYQFIRIFFSESDYERGL